MLFFCGAGVSLATAKQKTTTRMDTVVVRLISGMPSDEIAKLWYPLVEWFAARAPRFEIEAIAEFDVVWDAVVAAAALHPSGYKQKHGRDWSFESLNSVIGRLVLALFEIPLPENNHAVPAAWIDRLDRVLSLPGDHGRHALHLVAQQTAWFHHHQPGWTADRILANAVGTGSDADAFWSGFARMRQAPPPVVIAQLKSQMIARISDGDREERNLIAYLLSGWAAEGSERIVSSIYLRDLLVLGGDDVRRSALRFVSDWARTNTGEDS